MRFFVCFFSWIEFIKTDSFEFVKLHKLKFGNVDSQWKYNREAQKLLWREVVVAKIIIIFHSKRFFYFYDD